MRSIKLFSSAAICALSLACLTVPAFADETNQIGVGSGLDRAEASEMARLDAVHKLINAALGANSVEADEQIEGKVQEIRDSISDDFFRDTPPIPFQGRIKVKTTLAMDDVEFRNLLTEKGLDKSDSASSLKILALVDEFDTTPADPNQPLLDIVEMSTSKGSSMSDTSSASEFSKSSSAKASKSASSSYDAGSMAAKSSSSSSDRVKGSASQQSSGGFAASNGYGNASGGSQGSSNANIDASSKRSGSTQVAAGYVSASGASRSSASAQSASSGSQSKNNIHEEVHDDTSYRHVTVRADTTQTKVDGNFSYNALASILNSLRIVPVDPAAFRNQYIGPKFTVTEIDKNPAFKTWIAAANSKEGATNLLVGTTNIYQRGVNNFGQNQCSAVQALRVFDTKSGRQIALGQGRANGIGQGAQECSQDAAQALGKSVGAQVGKEILQFYKNQATYGTPYTVALKGLHLTSDQQDGFLRALKAVRGLKVVRQISVAETAVEYAITFSGIGADVDIGGELKKDPSLSSVSKEVSGENINFCVGSCASARSTVAQKR